MTFHPDTPHPTRPRVCNNLVDVGGAVMRNQKPTSKGLVPCGMPMTDHGEVLTCPHCDNDEDWDNREFGPKAYIQYRRNRENRK